MSILSTIFLVSFASFLIVYWLLKDKLNWQNVLVLVASYCFYSLINWHFSFLLLFTSLSVYCAGVVFSEYRTNKTLTKVVLILTIIIDVGILFLFKYYDFFAKELAAFLGVNGDGLLLHLLLPVGISFYTFTSLGYAIDVYNGKTPASRSIIQLFSFIAFFPLLLSGPIERSDGLLRQFKNKRVFDYSLIADGLQQAVWGVFKKLVIADNLAVVVSQAFSNYNTIPASSLLIGAFFYSFQIYFDFSGYSDIAVGMCKLMGFRVRRNFHYPYFALNVADFWKRWHMSLQSWLMEYIYFPLGGSRGTKAKTLINTFIVFGICGLWHGANWTFIAWGIYHAVLFIPLILFCSKQFRKTTVNEDKPFPSLREIVLICINFVFITIGWILFNAPNIDVATGYIANIFNASLFALPTGIGLGERKSFYVCLLLVVLLAFEWSQRSKEHPMQFRAPGWLKVIIMYVFVFLIIFCSAAQSDFIYYQF